jgi:hypothetical protein
MGAINLPFCILVFRYVECQIPPPDDPWNVWPFTNERFREAAGIASVKDGLSKPPCGAIGERLTPAVRKQWPEKAKGALQFLQHCDEQRQLVVDPSKWTMEEFQKTVMSKAPGRQEWAWVVTKCFDAPGGLYDHG